MNIDQAVVLDVAIELHTDGLDTVHFLNQLRLDDLYPLQQPIPSFDPVRHYYWNLRHGLYNVWTRNEERTLRDFIRHYPFVKDEEFEEELFLDFTRNPSIRDKNLISTRQGTTEGLILFHLPDFSRESFISQFLRIHGDTILYSNGRLPYRPPATYDYSVFSDFTGTLRLADSNGGVLNTEPTSTGKTIIIEPSNPLLLASQIINIILFLRGLIVAAQQVYANKELLLELLDPYGVINIIAYDETAHTEYQRLTYISDLHHIKQLITNLKLYLLVFDEHRYYLLFQSLAIDKTLIQFLSGDLPEWKNQGNRSLPANAVNLIGSFLVGPVTYGDQEYSFPEIGVTLDEDLSLYCPKHTYPKNEHFLDRDWSIPALISAHDILRDPSNPLTPDYFVSSLRRSHKPVPGEYHNLVVDCMHEVNFEYLSYLSYDVLSGEDIDQCMYNRVWWNACKDQRRPWSDYLNGNVVYLFDATDHPIGGYVVPTQWLNGEVIETTVVDEV